MQPAPIPLDFTADDLDAHRDAKKMRGSRPFLSPHLKSGRALDDVIAVAQFRDAIVGAS